MSRSGIHTYPSGIRTIFYKNPKSPNTTTIYWMCPVGSLHEGPGEYGITHLLEHFFFQGSAKFPNANSVADAYNRVGAIYNAYTYKYKTVFYLKVPNTRLSYAIDIMNNILCCATFPRDQFEREKHVIMEEIRKNRDVPYHRCEDEIDRILFHGTPYEHTITGNIGDIHNITYEAVCQYKAKHYTPDRMTVSVISNLPTPQLDRIFDRLSMFTTKVKTQNTVTHIPENIRIRPIDCAPILYRKLQTVHTHIMVGIFIPYPLKAREFVCYRIMSRIIAGNSSSRMFRRLRAQHGISYSSRCDLTYYPHIAKMDIYTSVEPSQYEKAFELMMGCIRDPITKDEFELARGYCKGTMYIHDDESVESRVEYEMDEMLFPEKSRLGVEWSDLLKIYGAITYKEFSDIVKQFYKNRVQIVVLGHQQLKSNPQKL